MRAGPCGPPGNDAGPTATPRPNPGPRAPPVREFPGRRAMHVAGNLVPGQPDGAGCMMIVVPVGRGHQSAQRRVPGSPVTPGGQHHHAPDHPSRRHRAAPVSTVLALPAGGGASVFPRRRRHRTQQRQVHSQHGSHTVLLTGQHVLDHPVQPVPVGARQDLRPVGRRHLRELVGASHTVVRAVSGSHAQMREMHTSYSKVCSINVKPPGQPRATIGR